MALNRKDHHDYEYDINDKNELNTLLTFLSAASCEEIEKAIISIIQLQIPLSIEVTKYL